MCVTPWRVYAKDEPFLNGSKSMVIPCGRCPECIKKRQNAWVVRFKLEQQYWRKVFAGSQTYFITLTYDDKHLPETRDMAIKNWQACLKSLYRNLNHRPRYYCVSENGSVHGRLHFHCLLFGMPVVDMDVFRKKTLAKAWPYGFNTCTYATGKTLWYVSKYVTKDISAFNSTAWKCIESYSKRPALGAMALNHQFKDYFSDNCTTHFVDSGFHYSLPRSLVKRVLTENQRMLLLDKYEREMPKEYDSTDPDQHFAASQCWRNYRHKCKEYKAKKRANILNYERIGDLQADE